MRRLLLTLSAILISSGTAMAQYKVDGKLKWTWDGSFLPPVLASPGLNYPSLRQANEAFRRAKDADPIRTIDFSTITTDHREPVGVFLFACKKGAYDEYRHQIQDISDVIHCMTYFTNHNRQKLFQAPVNFRQLDFENWEMVVHTRDREIETLEEEPKVIFHNPDALK